MATERLPMRKIKEILRLKWLEGRRHRHIARALEVSVGKVSAVVRKAGEVDLDWEKVERLGEAELEEAIYGEVRRRLKAPLPDPAWMDLELKKPAVTIITRHRHTAPTSPAGEYPPWSGKYIFALEQALALVRPQRRRFSPPLVADAHETARDDVEQEGESALPGRGSDPAAGSAPPSYSTW